MQFSGYRLLAPPYGFNQSAVALIFGVSLVGIVSAAWIGDLCDDGERALSRVG